MSFNFASFHLISTKYTGNRGRLVDFNNLAVHRDEKNLMEKGVQISANNVKIEVDHKTCISSGTLEIIEKIGKEVPVEQLELSKERTTENG